MAKYLRQQYPEFEDLTILELNELGGSWETDLYYIKVAGAPNGDRAPVELVLRLYKGAEPLEKAQKEFSLMAGVARYGIPTPRVDALVTDRSVLGDPFILMEYIQGGTLVAAIEQHGASAWLVPMMQVLARIHAVPWRELNPRPQSPIPNSAEPLAYVSELLNEMELAIEKHGLIGYGSTMNWLREHEVQGSSTDAALIHGDYHPQNILLKENSLVVIDWSFAEIGDSRMDLAWSAMLLDAMLEGDQRVGLVEAYEREVGSPVENLEFFEALNFALRMVTIGTWLDGRLEIPVAGITKQAIRGDYKVHVMNPYRRLKAITGLEIRTIEDL